MESSEVVITLFDDHLQKKRFVYDEPWICLVGRAEDCDIHIPSETPHLQVSRHHCLLEIHPPLVRVRDLGSTNGTFVNGQKITFPGRQPVESSGSHSTAMELREGDEIRLGQSDLRLRVEAAGVPLSEAREEAFAS